MEYSIEGHGDLIWTLQSSKQPVVFSAEAQMTVSLCF